MSIPSPEGCPGRDAWSWDKGAGRDFLRQRTQPPSRQRETAQKSQLLLDLRELGQKGTTQAHHKKSFMHLQAGAEGPRKLTVKITVKEKKQATEVVS